eukprot:scaffold2101_cov98-Isochrysis_galbana.AAC.2
MRARGAGSSRSMFRQGCSSTSAAPPQTHARHRARSRPRTPTALSPRCLPRDALSNDRSESGPAPAATAAASSVGAGGPRTRQRVPRSPVVPRIRFSGAQVLKTSGQPRGKPRRTTPPAWLARSFAAFAGLGGHQSASRVAGSAQRISAASHSSISAICARVCVLLTDAQRREESLSLATVTSRRVAWGWE